MIQEISVRGAAHGTKNIRSLNILLLFPHFNVLEQGSSLRSSQIAFFLAQQGHNVTVFAPGVDQRSEELFPEVRGRLYASYEIQGVRLIRARTLSHFRRNAKRRLAYDAIYATLTFLRSLTIRPLDAIVVAYPPNVMPVFAYLLAKIRHLPLVFEMRDLVADVLMSTSYIKSSLFVEVAKRIEHFAINHSDHIISISSGMKKVLVSRNVPATKISVVPLGYAPEVFVAADYTWNPRDKFGWGDRFVVIFAGTLNPAYDIPTLLRCAERLRQYEDILFVIVGGGEKKPEYQAYCATRNLTNCQFIDYQPRTMMPVILAAANVGVNLLPDNPVWACVLGNKTFDYLGSGLPMVYAGRGDSAELIQKARAGLVVSPEDDECLAEAILQLKGNLVEAKAMGERGRIFVLNHYSVPNLLERFEEVIQSMVSKRQCTPG